MTTAAPVASPARTGRVPFWDNARLACIVLVVLGHAVQRLTAGSDAALALYLVVYAFHMPAFAIISGYFSKAGPPTRRQMARLLTDVILPYLLFEGLWALVRWLTEGTADVDPTRPSWTLWFLLALGIFRLVLPYLALLRWPLLWTLAASVGAGYLPEVDETFSLARALGFLPLFTLGWWLRHHDVVARLDLLRRRWWATAAAVAAFAAAGAVAWIGAPTWRDADVTGWLFYDTAYGDLLPGTPWWAGAGRLAAITVGLVLSAAFFALVPRGARRWTVLGRYTMYVYLLHSFVLFPFRESGILEALEPTPLWLPVVCAVSVAVALLLATQPVRWAFRPLVEPRPRWLFTHPALLPGHRSDPTGARRSGRARDAVAEG